MYYTESFDVVTSDPYLVYFVPKRDLFMTYCTHRTELIITRKVFIKLCLNIAKIKHSGSDSQSLKQHQLLSPVECLLASCRLSL